MESSTYFFEETMNWTCINIEASPPIFEMLLSNRKKSININKGLSNKIDKITFEHAIHPNYGIKFGNGSFHYKPTHKQNLISENCTFQKYEVETTTYKELIDTIIDEKFPNKEVDLFVLDVEGLEVEVLEGMKDSKYLPKIMCIEYPHIGLNNLISEVLKLNYIFDTIKDNNAYFIKNDTNL
jgi:FkbM family methyltransferase